MNREQITKIIHQQHSAFINDVARLANELQAQFPNCSRSHCLKEAERLVGKYGLGCSLVK